MVSDSNVPPQVPVPAPLTSVVSSPVARPCPSCGRDWGLGLACQFCGQVGGLPAGVYIASAGRRFGGFVLDFILIGFTLAVGWLIWSLFTFKNGQTPGKQLLGMRCVKLRTTTAASWGTTFLREAVAKPVI